MECLFLMGFGISNQAGRAQRKLKELGKYVFWWSGLRAL